MMVETKEWFGLVRHSAEKQIRLIVQDGQETIALRCLKILRAIYVHYNTV